MIVRAWLKTAVVDLKSVSGVPELEARLLLAEALGLDGHQSALIEPQQELNKQELAAANIMLNERRSSKPISQIIGHKEFYGHRFKVTPDVMAPRPESEALVERAIKLITDHGFTSATDIGTGSGCLILSVATNVPKNNVILTACDNSQKALAVAKENATTTRPNIPVQFVLADIYGPSTTLDKCLRSDLIIANLPYVPTDYPINIDARFDPESALFSGADGLDHYRQLFSIIDPKQTKMLLIEHLPEQFNDLPDLINQHLGHSCDTRPITEYVTQVRIKT